MEIEIASRFTCSDWDKLKAKLPPSGQWTSGLEWQEVMGVVQRRIKERFLDPASALKDLKYAGFAVLALDCFLIETIQAFKSGQNAKTSSESRRAYKVFLTSSGRFRPFFSPAMVDRFYTDVRNGLLHDGETRNGWIVKANPKYALLDSQSNNFIVINRVKFHCALDEEFKDYVRDLSDRTRDDLRRNLVSALNDLCQRSATGYHP